MDTNTYKIIGVLAYLAVLIIIGVLASRRMKDVRDYYAAGKQLNFWAVAFSARATGESGWLLLGLTGMGALMGANAFFVVLGETLGVAGAWLLMSRRFHRMTEKFDAITIPDYLERRFGDEKQHLRKVAAFCLTTFVTIYVSAQIYATGQAFSDFLDWNFYVGIAVGFTVVMVYSISGGFLAVVWSDIFQGALMFFGLLILPIAGVIHAGGVDAVVDGLNAIDPGLMSLGGPEGWTTKTILTTIGLALIGVGFLGSPQIFVRFLALRDEAEINKGAAVAIIWTLIADSGAVLTGMIGRHLLTQPGDKVEVVLNTGAEAVLPIMVETVFPGVLVGLYIAIVLSAIMSTVDSLLVVASSAAVRDYYQQVKNPGMPDNELVSKSRIATFIIALIALGVALVATSPGQTVFWFVVFGWSGIAATFCPTVILSVFWKGFTKRGALGAMLTGFLMVPILKFGVSKIDGIGEYFGAITELPPAFVASMLVGVLLSITDEDGRAKAETWD